MTKTTQDMNNSIKFKVYSLKFKEMLRCGRGMRFMLLLAAMLLGGVPAMGQVVIMNGNYFLTHNEAGTSVNSAATTSFNPNTCLWAFAQDDYVRTANSSGTAISNDNNYLQYTSLSLGTDWGNWYRARSNGTTAFRHRTGGTMSRRYHYPTLSGSTWGWAYNQTSDNSSTYLYSVTRTHTNLVDNTTSPTISILSYDGNTINFSHTNLTGTFTPEYTRYQFNSTNHYWYNDSDHNSAPSAVNANTLSPTYTWSLTANGGGVASIDPSTGVLTLSGAPTGNITVQLTVSNISPLGNKTVDFTLTRTHYNEVVSTTATITGLTVSPTTATLEYNENQEFTASATVNATTSTTQAYDRLQGGGNTYYYYGGTLHTSTPTASVEESHPDPTFGWALSGTAATYLSLSTTSGATTTATHSTGAQSNSNATLTVTASTPGASNSTATATITVVPTPATAIDAEGTTLYVGNGGTVTYTLTPAYAYDRVRATSASTSIFTVDASPVSGGSVSITAVAPGQANLNLVALKPDGTDGPTKAVAITVRDVVAVPVISFAMDGSTVKATLTCATGGATIKYTTDGSDPTTSGTAQTYSGTPFTVTDGTTVKAYAEGPNAYWDASTTVTKVCRPIDYVEQGVSGDVVTLNDLEDHSWSYYSDPDCPIRSLSPADVKITYYGDGIVMTGNADYTAESVEGTNYIKPGNANYGGGAKVNVGGEDENTFIYYKTLERGDATQTAWTFSSGSQSSAASRCPYTTIPNPFQVRPTYGSRGSTDANDFTGWRGFQCWRLKSVSGGAVYSAASGGDPIAVNAIINANTQIYFAPNSEYGMEVELEAVWARAYLIKGNQSGANTILSQNVGVERNFMTLTTNENYRFNGNSGRYITNVGYPVTISCYYPSGEAPDNTNGVVTGNNNNITLGANTKFENVTLSAAAYTLTTSGYDVIVGRGCTSTNVGTVRGMSGGSSSAVNYTIRLESGTYGTFALIDNTARTFSSTVSTRAIFGSDYDRAKSDNAKLSIAANSTIYGGDAVHVFNSASNRNNLTYDWLIKSGIVQGSKSVTDANADESIYIGNSGNNDNTQYMGKRRFIMEGGEIASLAGSLNSYGNNRNTYIVNDGDAVEIRVKGGTIRGSVYGAAAYASATGNRRFIFTGGEVGGWIAGGANGTQSDGGYLYGSTKIYIGGHTSVNSNSSTSVINRAVGGNVFGAGCGYGASSNSGQVTEGTTVVVADEAYVERGVYGGGSYGYTTDTANIYILGGTVDGKNGGVNGTTYQASITGGVFGGACQNQGGTVNITMKGGEVHTGLYGGSNATGTISGNVTMHIDGGQVGTTSANANIHGGGYGQPTRVSRNVEITLGSSCTATEGVTVYGDVYGGSALGYVNGTSASDSYHTYVTLNKGTIYGSLYGGGLGDGSNAANVYGPVQVKVFGGSVKKTDANGANGSGSVYGCNNINGAPQRAVSVDIYGTDPQPSEDEYALFAVYGGGNQADYSYGTPTVTVHNCDNSIEYVYGGGNAAHITNGNTDVTIYGGNKIGNVFGGGNGTVTAANVSGNTDVKIYGGTIGKVFGGSNSRGTIGGTISVNATAQTEAGNDPCLDNAYQRCPIQVGELYGGGNMAASNVGNIDIGCMNAGDMIDYVYGGSNNAAITGDISLTMTGGRIGNLFGGNNTGSTISGGINVTVNWNNSCSNNYLGNVFGGGNLAQYTIPDGKTLQVNILNGTVSGNVYGGGKGLDSDHTKGQVTGNPVVTIGDNNGSHQVTVSGDVYGGGDAGNVVGTPQVNVINKCNTNVANVYGGGNAADVSATDVNIDGGTIGMVFGGGHGNKNSEPQKVANVNGAVAVDITGGTISKVFGGSNSKGTISGAVTVDINKGNSSCEMHITEVYGGGNEANGNAGIITIGCTGDYETNGEGIVDVYGGANQADIGNNINLTVTGGHINRLFGGNNTSGNISGTIAVNVNWTTGVGACSHNYMGDVFGGGNLAAYSGSPSVTLTNGTVSGNIYGGGNEAGVGGSTVNINGGAMTAGKGIYGGCNTSGVVSGDIAVNINGGSLGTAGNALYGIFGGGYGQSTSTTGNVTVTIGDAAGTKTPTIYGDIYGGSALGSVNSDANDLTKIDFLNGTLHGNIYGGGLGDAGDASKGWVNGEVQVNISSESQAQANCHIDLRDADIYGCNNTNGSPQADVTVHIWKTGYVTGDYSAQTGSLYAIDEVFGGGNQADYAPENGDVNSDKKATVYVHDCINSIRRLFGGGNKAAATGIATTIDGGRFEYVFGGGNGEVGAADVGLGGTNLTVHSGRIVHLFGGSNTNGTISGPMLVNVDYEKMGVSGCDENIGEFFGGGNLAVLGDAENPVNLSTTIACNTIFTDVYGGSNLAAIYGNVTLTVNGGTIQNLYGGSKGAVGTPANITGNVKLNIYGGDIGRAYGGSNINGNITGTIGVDLDWSQSVCSQKEIDYIYGGSNQTAYTPTNASGISPDVKLINGTVNERVYGGGRGSGAVVTSNPRVTAGAAGKNVVVLGSIFGGGDAAQVSGNTDVNVIHSAIVGSMAGGEGNIFGGGNAATVTGDTKVYLGNRAKIYGNVYGGGNQGEVNGDTKVIVNSD